MADLNPLPVSPEQRRQIYEALLQRLMAGRTLTSAELQVLAYGIYQDSEVDFAPNVQEIFNHLDTTGSPQAEAFERAIAGADVARPDPVAQQVQDTIVTLGAGGAAAGALGAAKAGTSVIGGAIRGASRASLDMALGGGVGSSAGGLMGGTVGGMIRSILSHPFRSLALGGGVPFVGGLLGFFGDGEQPSGTVDPGADTSPRSQVPSWGQWRGRMSPAPSYTQSDRRVDLSTLIDVLTARRPIAGTVITDEMRAVAEAAGVRPEQLDAIAASTYTPYEEVNPLALGLYNFDSKNFPFGATGAGIPAAPELTSKETQEALEAYRKIQNLGRTSNSFGFLQEDIQSGFEDIVRKTTGQVRPDGQVIQAAFSEYQGQTLLQHVLDAARQYGVPPALLYGIIAHESGFNPRAIGDNGQSHGLVQIYQPAWPGISRTQATNPLFAINWAANHLRNNFAQLGTWEAAAMSHNNPVGAREFAATGTIKDSTRRTQLFNYAANVFGYATQSGIGDEIFGGDLLAAGAGGPRAAGPKDMSARQISDLKAGIRELWEAWMGPGEPDENYLNQWANWIFNGKKGADDVETSIRAMAHGRWPNKPEDLTWTEWATPYKTKIQDMLEIPKLDNVDSLLTRALDSQVEGRDLDLLIRKDDRWQRTANYRDEYSRAAIELGRAFGYTA